MFAAPWFLFGGLIALAGLTAVHLMHRRHYRVVHWAAMEFLLQAAQRNRRLLQLRDLLLYLLRAAFLLLFALGMARPYLPGSSSIDYSTSVHLVLIVDNSLSMGYTELGSSLLDDAKRQAEALLQSLPGGSRATVIPAADPARDWLWGAYPEMDDALAAVRQIERVDRLPNLGEALRHAAEVCRRVPTPAAKRVVILSDGQQSNWRDAAIATAGRALARPIEIRMLRPTSASNTWVQDVFLRDRFGIQAEPAVVVARVGYRGTSPRQGVEVRLKIDGIPAASQVVDLQPGEIREILFPPVPLPTASRGEGVSWMAAEVTVSPDALPSDDSRTALVPLFPEFPAVFVDQVGQDETVFQDRFGETYLLRRLLIAGESDDPAGRQRQLTAITPDRLDREMLAAARLVVVAGIRSPGPAAQLLTEYALFGGNVLVAAGGEFDAAAWNAETRQAGWPLLPLPLQAIPFDARLGGDVASGSYLQWDLDSLRDESFRIEGMDADELAALLRTAYFFQIVVPDTDVDSPDPLSNHTDKQPQPAWLTWRNEDRVPRIVTHPARLLANDGATASRSGNGNRKRENAKAEIAERATTSVIDSPRVLARFTNGMPCLIEKALGQGRVLFWTSGLAREWNTLAATPAVIVLDRLCRRLVEETLETRNISSVDACTVLIPDGLRGDTCRICKPDGTAKPVVIGAMGERQWGADLGLLPRQGEYRLQWFDETPAPDGAGQGSLAMPRAELRFTVSAPPDESDLQYIDGATARATLGAAIAADNSGPPSGLGASGLWRLLIWGGLLLLLAESLYLASPRSEARP